MERVRGGVPRRVLWVDHARRILGGAEVNLVELLGAACGRGDWESVVACDPEGPLDEALGREGVVRVPYRLGDALGTFRAVGRRLPLGRAWRAWRAWLALHDARKTLATLVAEWDPDVVVSCTNKDHFAAGAVCRGAGVPSVWWVNDALSADFFPRTARWLFTVQAWCRATRCVAVSEFVRRSLLQLGLPGGRVVAVPNGIPLERYRRREAGVLRGELGLGADVPLVGMVGRYTPWKGQDLFLKVARDWCRDGGGGQFVLMGGAFNEDQGYEAALRREAGEGVLRGRVHWVAFRREVTSVLSDLDLVVHASRKPEPFGRVLIEAMAAGVPVLAARAGAVPEIIYEGVNGLLAGPGEVGEYRRQMERGLKDRLLRERLVREGLRTVRERFTVERVRDGFAGVFAAVGAGAEEA
ncbi:MAG: glycosyltransferase family 4 protein [Verrucomicrobiae bacterium]|nr:glycosyltransferase family 4 protein [Verrucomicrobiae bacterium]